MQSTGHGQVTSGSNGNGNWIRFPDGTQICTKSISLSVPITSAWGTMYISSATQLGYVAKNFISAPIVHASISSNPSTCILLDLSGSSVDGFGKAEFAHVAAVSVSIILNLVAIGRWR